MTDTAKDRLASLIVFAAGIAFLTLLLVASFHTGQDHDDTHPNLVKCRSLGGVVQLSAGMRFAGCLLPPVEPSISASKVGP